MRLNSNAKVCILGVKGKRGGVDACKVTRVSLSDWLAFQARIRGFENPRLLRDRPTDGAARAAKFMRGMRRGIVCKVRRCCGGLAEAVLQG